MDDYPRPEPVVRKPRSGWLTGVLVLIIVGSGDRVWWSVKAFYQIAEGARGQVPWYTLLYYCGAYLYIVAAIALFLWKRWGVYLVLAVDCATFVTSIFRGAQLPVAFTCFTTIIIVSAALAVGGDQCGWKQLE